MKVLIDADGCPVVDAAVRLCGRYGVSCVILCDTAHEFHREGAVTVVADQGADSVDYMLVNRTEPQDIVITQDYGLASMCLAKQARVMHQDGWEFTPYNIDALLFARHESRKLRSAGHRMKGPGKRKQEQNRSFVVAFEALLQTMLQG